MSLKKKIINNELTIGSWLSLGDESICEMMLNVGFDWIVIDMEHTAISVEKCINLIRIIELGGCKAFVRVGENNSLLIKRSLDAGAHGIVVPMVNSVDDALSAVRSTYYPPIGKRGYGLARAHNYGRNFDRYVNEANSEIILIVQIEHFQSVENLQSIISIDGIDGFIIGPYDLSGSLDCPGNWEDENLIKCLEDVQSVIDKKIKTAGYHIINPGKKEIKSKIDQGYRFIAYSREMILMSQKLHKEKNKIAQIKKISK